MPRIVTLLCGLTLFATFGAPGRTATAGGPEPLAVLKPEEKGSPDFTIEGWLGRIEGKRGPSGQSR